MRLPDHDPFKSLDKDLKKDRILFYMLLFFAIVAILATLEHVFDFVQLT